MVPRTDTGLVQRRNRIIANQRFTGRTHINSKWRETRMPLSMILYATCLHHFLLLLADTLPALWIGRHKRFVPVLAYADDVKIFVTQPAAFTAIQRAIQCYESATGALINLRKSKATALGKWAAPATDLGIGFQDHINVLGVTFKPSIAQSIKDNWIGVICAVRAQAKTACAGNLSLAQRLHYVQMCLLTKLWYVAQIFPLSTRLARQLTTVCTWFIWKGAAFMVPISILQRPKEEGGWNMPNTELKCKTLLYNRIQLMGSRGNSVLTELRIWDPTTKPANPTNQQQISFTLPHLRPYAMDMAYITPLGTEETRKHFKRRTYTVLLYMAETVLGDNELPVVRKHPQNHCKRIWTNHHSPAVTDTLTSTWYTAVHDLIPTNVRLASIHLTETISCNRCGQPDSLQQRIADCGEGPIIWNWTREKRADTPYGPLTHTTVVAAPA
jgi:hypothetical protein